MNLVADELVYITEGEVYEICVMVSEQPYTRDRDVHLSFSVLSSRNTSGRLHALLIHYLVIGNFI